MQRTPNKWYVTLLGGALMGATSWAGWHIIVHGVEHPVQAWIAVGTGFAVGFWVAVPYTAKTFFAELRDWIEWWRGGTRSDE